MSTSPMPPVPGPGPGPGPTAVPAAATPGSSFEVALRRVRAVALVAGLLILGMAAALVFIQWVQPREEPWRSPALTQAKAQLQEDSRNEELKTRIRTLDLELRQAYFRSLERNRTAAWILLAAGTLLVLVGREIARPAPGTPLRIHLAGPDRERTFRRARATVIGTGLVCGASLLAVGITLRPRLPGELAADAATPSTRLSADRGPGQGAAPVSATAGPALEPAPGVWARNWPQFRGPTGANAAAAGGGELPLTWDVASGQGVVWRTNVALPGYNSPVVWEDRVFLTGGDKKTRLVYCFDAGTGALRWSRPVTPTNGPAAAVDPPDQSGAAASTVATDGRRVFAVFATGELGALDFEGTLVWHTRLDFSENGYGHASSLVLAGGRLLVQADQGQPEDGKSQLLALDTATGKTVWTAKRPVGGSWATPLVVGEGNDARVITQGDPWLMAHEVRTGTEIWRAKLLGGELAPSAVLAGGLVVAVHPGHLLVALKLDGTGDVTASHVAWKLDREVPDVPTPVVSGDLLFTADTEGHLICREAATGVKVWEHGYEMEIQATPLVAGNRIYLFAQQGNVFVAEVGRQFRELAAFEMGDEIYASPAVAGGRLFVRTKSTLYCLGTAAAPTQVAHHAR